MITVGYASLKQRLFKHLIQSFQRPPILKRETHCITQFVENQVCCNVETIAYLESGGALQNDPQVGQKDENRHVESHKQDWI